MTSTRDEIRIGPLAVRFLLESEASASSAPVFDVLDERTCPSLGGDSRGRE